MNRLFFISSLGLIRASFQFLNLNLRGPPRTFVRASALNGGARLEMRGAETRVSVRNEASLFQRYAEVSGLLVSDDRAGVTIGFQKLPDNFVDRDSFRAGKIDHAIQRLRNRDTGQGRGHIIGNDGSSLFSDLKAGSSCTARNGTPNQPS